jgi:hypothetical protein
VPGRRKGQGQCDSATLWRRCGTPALLTQPP